MRPPGGSPRPSWPCPATWTTSPRRYGRAGGATTFPARIGTLGDARGLAPSARVIVNCTGCGARDLVPDPEVTPVRGQVVVAANPGITEFFVGTSSDPGDLTYLFPHGDVVVLGGTEQPGNWSLEPDPATADADHRRLRRDRAGPARRDRARAPGRTAARPAERCGWRPCAEPEQDGEVTIVHNYGHGGAGVTLSWGCAEDAAELVLAALG